MASVLHRATREFRPSVNTPDFSPADWIINPDLSAVAGHPVKYWVVTGDVVSLMDTAARAAAAAAEQSALKEAIADELVSPQTVLRAFAEVVLDEINVLRAEHGLPVRTLAQLKTAVRGKL